MGKLLQYIPRDKQQAFNRVALSFFVCRLSTVVHEDKAFSDGRWIVKKLKDVIPRQMFKVNVQAILGGKIIASEHISPFRKGTFHLSVSPLPP